MAQAALAQASQDTPNVRDDTPGGGRMGVAKDVFRRDFARLNGFSDSRLEAALAPRCETRATTAPEEAGLARRSDHDLVVRLCQMPADLAAPLLRSPLPALDTAALLSLLKRTGADHHALVAARRGIDWRVVKALIREGHPAALHALAGNATVEFDHEDRAALMAAAAADPVLAQALGARQGDVESPRPAVPPRRDNLRLVALIRAGQRAAFRREAARRVDIDPAALDAALDTASPVPFALVLAALGFDRAAALDLLPLWRQDLPPLGQGQRALLAPLLVLDPPSARDLLQALAAKAVAGQRSHLKDMAV